jgi:hypothetical protein
LGVGGDLLLAVDTVFGEGVLTTAAVAAALGCFDAAAVVAAAAACFVGAGLDVAGCVTCEVTVATDGGDTTETAGDWVT